jgi:DNA invertase Pin-like site-specific DNA recombinase
MMPDKIRTEHRQRLAIVYIRQSSPGQVKNHPESYRVQKRLVKRAAELGWAADRIRVVEGDQAESASLPGNRADFEELLGLVRDKQVGIVFGVDVSRLARNSLDWSLLTHWCAWHGALLGDQTQVLDPTLPQDSLVLGIQGVLAIHELHAIRQRLRQGLEEKASRGELHHGRVPRGFVVVEGKHLRKHPDRRVQQAVARVFQRIQTCRSVGQLVVWMWENDYQLPRAASGDGMQVEWVPVNYLRVLDMLKNPKYAGIYVHPRYKTETNVLPDGTVKKRVRRARPEEWEVVLKDHHPAYLNVEAYEANQQKIVMNAQRFAAKSSGAPHKGSSLLSGLVECRRCQHKMQVHYGRSGQVTYSCRKGRRQRDGGSQGCFRFAAEELERQLSEQILAAVSPAGVAAAELASQRLFAQREERRRNLVDALEHLRYEADLTRRRFDNVDPANHLVFETLASELEAALRAVQEQEGKLAEFDREEPARPTSEERDKLHRLSRRLEDVWYHPQSDGGLKKQIVRLLIEHVYADVDEEHEEVVLWVKWSGGHHTELRASRRRRGRAKIDLPSIVGTLRKVCDDEAIARSLNRAGIETERGATWTKRRVSMYRNRHSIPSFKSEEKVLAGWLTQQEAATKLEISPMTLHRLVDQGILPAEGVRELPRVIQRRDLDTKDVRKAVKDIKSHGNSPLPENPNQLSLFQ